ncbi:hypothetical protein BC936DRAFT_145940 [Jimgerdemannia flammicorona]|uniref:Uncharacterized protein n=1 Tax=Jimgerdemannia flammicorona TaxID=994334 RepID=A0A433D8Q3_9FUNG|nr:hypothetical protein BC936DRAFT_145940 [Jimgerdemannia flammicorona]
MLSYPKHHKPLILIYEDQCTLWSFHFKKKYKNNKWPSLYKIMSDYKLTYLWKTDIHIYSPIKGIDKIRQYDIGYIVCLCQHVDNLIFRKDKLVSSNSKHKQKKAQ